MRDLMIDIETLGTGPASAVIAIGAVFFSLDTGEIGETFYDRINLDDACKYGRVTGGTLKFWDKQSPATRKEAWSGVGSAKDVLEHFEQFVLKGEFADKVCVWGNGPAFDLVIMERQFQRVLDRQAPWQYWNHQCCRTINRLAGTDFKWPAKDRVKDHNALYDAQYQTEKVIAQWAFLRGKGKTKPTETKPAKVEAPVTAPAEDDEDFL